MAVYFLQCNGPSAWVERHHSLGQSNRYIGKVSRRVYEPPVNGKRIMRLSYQMLNYTAAMQYDQYVGLN